MIDNRQELYKEFEFCNYIFLGWKIRGRVSTILFLDVFSNSNSLAA